MLLEARLPPRAVPFLSLRLGLTTAFFVGLTAAFFTSVEPVRLTLIALTEPSPFLAVALSLGGVILALDLAAGLALDKFEKQIKDLRSININRTPYLRDTRVSF